MCHIAFKKNVYYTGNSRFGSTQYTKDKEQSYDRSKEGTENLDKKN